MTLSAIEIIGNALFVVMAVGGVMLSLIPRRREREMLHLLKRAHRRSRSIVRLGERQSASRPWVI
jgi:hypothetical protein